MTISPTRRSREEAPPDHLTSPMPAISTPPTENRMRDLWIQLQENTRDIIEREAQRAPEQILVHRGERGFSSSTGPTMAVYEERHIQTQQNQQPQIHRCSLANRVGAKFATYPIFAACAPRTLDQGRLLFNATQRGDFCVDLRPPNELPENEEEINIISVLSTPFSPSQPQSTIERSNLLRYAFPRWTDGATIELQDLDELVTSVNKTMDIRRQHFPNARLWVNCYAGVGRTGTLITAKLLKDRIEHIRRGQLSTPTEETLPRILAELILTMREERSSWFVQTEGQMQLLYRYGHQLLNQPLTVV